MITNDTPQFPNNWQIRDYDPNDHMMQLKGRDYLNVQNRLLWFVRDQRDFIVRGLAQMPYVIRSEVVELDTERGYAHFRTYVRDVLGNEATMYGSEQAKDFADYAEKASTKSLGRALLALGYGTAAAPEMDEGERVVDTPVERPRKPTPLRPQNAPTRAPQPRETAVTPEAATHPTPTTRPAPPAVDAFDATPANRNAQTDLLKLLKAAGHDTPAKANRMINAAIGRTVNIPTLLAGESDLTMDEVGKIIQSLATPLTVKEAHA